MIFYNGNGQKYQKGLPDLVILHKINDVAIEHIRKQTRLQFKWTGLFHIAKPKTAEQITKLFMTYNYKTQYHDNATTKNTIYLKSDHHVGFKVDSICYDCVKENNVVVSGLTKESRLAC